MSMEHPVGPIALKLTSVSTLGANDGTQFLMLGIRNAVLMLANDKDISHEICRGPCAVRMHHVEGD